MEEKKFAFAQTQNYQQLLTNPILDIAARFWDTEKYNAFKVLYKPMRIVDDLVDDRKSLTKKISKTEKKEIVCLLNAWIKSIENPEKNDLNQKQLIEVIQKFKIPLYPWKKFTESMIYDINNTGFKTFQSFLNYAKGAAIAPATIYMHLCGLSKEKEEYTPPKYNPKNTAKPLALFCYLVHIMRDFQKDQSSNLNYFAEDLMKKNKVTNSSLKEIAAGKKINPGFRNLMKKYYDYAEHYRKKSREMIDETSKHMEPRYKLSLEIIYDLYLQIFERIDVEKGNFTSVELNPLPEEIKNRIELTIQKQKPNKKDQGKNLINTKKFK